MFMFIMNYFLKITFFVFILIIFPTNAFAQPCTTFNTCGGAVVETTHDPDPVSTSSEVTIYAQYYATDVDGNKCNIASASVSSTFGGTMSWDSANERYYVTTSTSGLSSGIKTYSVTASKASWNTVSDSGTINVNVLPTLEITIKKIASKIAVVKETMMNGMQ